MPASSIENIVIIGSGPAAWTAAIYAARANLRPLVFEGEPVGTELPGGQLMLTTDIENFPGFPEPVSGPELMERIKAQAVHHGTRVVSELVKQVDFSQRPFTITPNYSEPVQAHTVIVATGAAAKWIGLESELRLAQQGGGVSACAVCDGAMPFYRNKRLAVVGGGDLLGVTDILYGWMQSEKEFGGIRKASPKSTLSPRRRAQRVHGLRPVTARVGGALLPLAAPTTLRSRSVVHS